MFIAASILNFHFSYNFCFGHSFYISYSAVQTLSNTNFIDMQMLWTLDGPNAILLFFVSSNITSLIFKLCDFSNLEKKPLIVRKTH